VKKSGQPKCRPTHEHSGRVGQAWKAGSVQVIGTSRASGESKIFEMPRGSVSCPTCHEVIRYDHRGFAFCQCQIHNGSHNYSKNVVKHRGYGKFMGTFCKASL